MATCTTNDSVRIRGFLTDCNGDMVSELDVSKICVNISNYFGNYETVEGYNMLEIPTSVLKPYYLEDENGMKFNFDFNPYVEGCPMFPNRKSSYLVEVIFYDLNEIPSAHHFIIHTI